VHVNGLYSDTSLPFVFCVKWLIVYLAVCLTQVFVFYWSVPLPSVCPGGLVKQATQCILYLSG